MKRSTAKKTFAVAGVAALALTGSAVESQAADARVTLNGQPLATSVEPIQRNNRVLVPMRDIFEALGAEVKWNQANRAVTAKRGGTNVWLQIGNRTALVNNANVRLEQAAMMYQGNTMVPLRFVSEAMGANVMWNGPRRIASIFTPVRSGSEVRAGRTITVPAGAVVKVRLDQALSSATARRGDTFTATVVSERPGDSEFPTGSKLVGVVTEARPQSGKNPGILGLDFRSVILPNSARYNLDGSLIGLDEDSVVERNGRIIAKSPDKSPDAKIIGIGAAAGYVLGRVLDQNKLITTILGGAAGYIYDRSQKGDVKDAVVGQSDELGVRLDRSLTYTDNTNYADERATFLQ